MTTTEVTPVPMRDLSVDALYLANTCEVLNGLLYVMGGGWMRCWPDTGREYPYERSTGIVLLIRVPYNRTDNEHTFLIAVRDSDERQLAKVEGTFKLGRDPWLSQGMSQIVPVAVQLPLRLESTGIYHVVANLNGAEKQRIEFEALAERPGT